MVEGYDAYHVGQYSPELIAAMISVINTETGLTVPVLNSYVGDIGETGGVALNFTIGYTSTVNAYVESMEFETDYIDLLKTVPGLSDILFQFTSESMTLCRLNFFLRYTTPHHKGYFL